MLRPYLDAFWNEAFWLPKNVTWRDIEPGPGKAVAYTDYRYMVLALPMGLVLILLRFTLDKYAYAPLGRALGIKETRKKQVPLNDTLEAAYKANPALNEINALAKKLDVSERQVARWWRLRRAQAKPSNLVRFCETSWRCTVFFFNFSSGVFILWDKNYLWDIDHNIIGYPHQGVTQDVCWYYMLQTAFYWSQMFTLLWDVRRKDFWQMVIHHLAAIVLLSCSWVCNLYRISTVITLISDGAETLLEMAKAAQYAGYKKFADAVFVLFTVTWVITRLWIYPFHILRSITFHTPMYVELFPALFMLNCLCYLIMALNIFWTWLIFKMLFKVLKTGHAERDIRSSSSDNDSSQSDHEKSDQSPQLFGNVPADQGKLAKNEEALKIFGTFLEAEEPSNKYTIS